MKYTSIFFFLFLTSLVSANWYCPVPEKDRVPNYTGVQCVFSSLELIGNFCEDSRLYKLTDKHKNASGPGEVAQILNRLGVPFEQTTNKEEAYKLLEKSTKNSIPCLIGIYSSHAIAVVHYDPDANRCAIIDNSNLQKGIQEMTISELQKKMDGWCVILYPDSRHKVNNFVEIQAYYLNEK